MKRHEVDITEFLFGGTPEWMPRVVQKQPTYLVGNTVKAYCNWCKKIGKQSDMLCIYGYMFCDATCAVMWRNNPKRTKKGLP